MSGHFDERLERACVRSPPTVEKEKNRKGVKTREFLPPTGSGEEEEKTRHRFSRYFTECGKQKQQKHY